MTEDDRYHPYQQLEGALDARGATVGIELLPPGGLVDPATKRYPDHLWNAGICSLTSSVGARIFNATHSRKAMDLRFDRRPGTSRGLYKRILCDRHRLVTTALPVGVFGCFSEDYPAVIT